MSIRGEIQTMPLPDLFQWLQGMHKTGVLSLGQGTILREFHLKEGLIANATSIAHPAVDSGEHVRRILIDTLPWMEGNFEFLETQLSEEIDTVQPALGSSGLDT